MQNSRVFLKVFSHVLSVVRNTYRNNVQIWSVLIYMSNKTVKKIKNKNNDKKKDNEIRKSVGIQK